MKRMVRQKDGQCVTIIGTLGCEDTDGSETSIKKEFAFFHFIAIIPTHSLSQL